MASSLPTVLICLSFIGYSAGYKEHRIPDFPLERIYEMEYDGYYWRNTSPYVVALFTQKMYCACTLINLLFCITGAECFEYDQDVNNMIINAGSTNHSVLDPRSQVRKVKKITIHEGYKPGGYVGMDDIAVVEFTQELIENYRVKPARMPTKFMLNRTSAQRIVKYFNAMLVWRDDYGIPGTIEYDVRPAFKCYCGYKIKDALKVYDGDIVVGRVICFYTYDSKTQKIHTICKDTPGSPVMIGDTVIAIQSIGVRTYSGCVTDKDERFERVPCCYDDTSQALYLQVYSYNKWIREIIGPATDTIPAPKAKIKVSHYSFNLQEVLPIILCVSLYFIVTTVVFICYRAILPNIL